MVIGARAFWAPKAAVGFGIPGAPVEEPVFQSWLRVAPARRLSR
ncbi:hypothetical protein OUY22_31945 [Nonomuraea sp. MCN248]|uniref:Uncharacterized protein n=1 Tax=Nonomuraea corallina TaxID=2989783 RepID=A0ABT4SM80_9ACTN|nr:hypothetical protein [Nonomuraea corallina]MDA0638045.1 hypothetical protein [Nonomuraea corallina]